MKTNQKITMTVENYIFNFSNKIYKLEYLVYKKKLHGHKMMKT